MNRRHSTHRYEYGFGLFELIFVKHGYFDLQNCNHSEVDNPILLLLAMIAVSK